MKTLLINIYRDITSIYPNTEIFNAGKDNILNGFYISLGMAIAEGVSVEEYKSLVVDFAVAKPTEFELFQKQWDELKLALLGDTPKGEYTFQLPSEYLEWLKINASTVYYKKYQGQHQASIRLDIEELYEDTVDAIRRKVLRFLQENDNYKHFDEFVVNDNIVNRRSKLVRAIKEKYEDNIAFVLYEKWKEDIEENVCPNCGKNPCECKNEEENNQTFSYGAEQGSPKKSISDKCLFIAVDQKKMVNVIDAKDHRTIYQGKHDRRNIRIVSESGQDVLYIEYGYPEKWMKITSDGNIQKDLSWQQTSMSDSEPLFDDEEFLKKYPKYSEAYSLGYLKSEKAHIVVTGSESYVEVRTSKGRLLFKIGNPYDCHAFPREITSSGYIIVEDREEHKGLWSIQGKEIIPCAYKEIKDVNRSIRIKSSDYIEVEDDDYNTFLYNIKTKELLSEITEFNRIKTYSEDDVDFMDVTDLASNQTVLRHICYNSGMSGELVNGWYRIHEWKERDGYMNTLSYILVKGNKYFRMPSKGEILEEVFSSGSTPNERYFVSEDRIITCMEKDNGDNSICAENMEFINIRDYNGNIINTKRHPTIWPLHPYRYNKVLAFKIVNDTFKSLIYLDYQGKEHNIPRTNNFYIEYPYKVAHDGKCTFVSEDTFIVDCSDDERDYKLMDINGNILIDKAWDLEELCDGYILYAKDYDKIGVIDSHGYEVIRPLYRGLTIIRGNSKEDEFQEYRLFN